MTKQAPASFEREERYIVVKRKNLSRGTEADLLDFLARRGLSRTDAVVVERGWPEYEPVRRMLEQRFTNPCQHCVGKGHILDALLLAPNVYGMCQTCDGTGIQPTIGDKPPTLDTAPHDLAHGPEVPHHRFSVFHEAGDYAYARGLEVNPTHLPLALDAMRKSGWHLVSLFGETDSKHVGFIFRREVPNDMADARRIAELLTSLDGAQARINDLLCANNALVEQNRALKRPPPRQSYSELEPGRS